MKHDPSSYGIGAFSTILCVLAFFLQYICQYAKYQELNENKDEIRERSEARHDYV